MISGRGNSKAYFEMTIAGCSPKEIAQRCGTDPANVSHWLARNRSVVREAQKIYRDRLIDALLLEQLRRCRVELDALELTEDPAQAAAARQPVMQSLNTNTAAG